MANTVTIKWLNSDKKAANINRLAERVGTVHMTRWGAAVAEDGKETVNYTILSGGVNSTAKGGPRIKDGGMIDSVFGDAKNAGAVVTARAGYMRPPKHTLFQEEGTRSRPGNSGIPAMLSLVEALKNMEIASDTEGTKMLLNIAKEWNTV